MLQRSSPSDALAVDAERAGMALACAFSSSDEFEADVIRERRAAGFYGPRRHRHFMAFAFGLGIVIGFIVLI
jgi:hypothetical protein